ncbi:MAG: hypothetical protein HY722_14955 [Planctomycetes bacterium]|nr:hypothetical protein [Planctomycetota bacterium]
MTPVRRVRLATHALLRGAETRLALALHPRAADLLRVERIALRAIPDLPAEIALALDGLVREPHGCFEQTSAATWPSLMALELAGTDPSTPTRLHAAAREAVRAGAARLSRFQLPDGSFSLYGEGPGDPWLTAYGLELLTALAPWGDVDPERVRRAAAALLAFRAEDGRFAGGRAAWRGPRAGDLAVTAYAVAALGAADRAPEDLESSVAWLRAAALDPTADAYGLALVARAFQRLSEPPPELAAVMDRLAASAVSREDGSLVWPAARTLTGTGGPAAQAEASALAAQALARAGWREMAERAAQGLALGRGPGGFGGTQATVQALETFRLLRQDPPRGLLRATIAGREVAALALGGAPGVAGPGPIEADLAVAGYGTEDLSTLARRHGVELHWQGQGQVQVQVRVEGPVAWESPLEDGGLELAPPALAASWQRPGHMAPGVPQTWTLEVRCTAPEGVFAPMVELALGEGVSLVEDGGLEAALAAGAIHAHERQGERLVLYLRHLGPGPDTVRIALRVVALRPGEVPGALLRAWPYYRPEEGLRQAEEPFVVAVEAGTDGAPSGPSSRPADAGGPGAADAATGATTATETPAPAGAPEPRPPEAFVVPAGALEVAIDPDLGPWPVDAAALWASAVVDPGPWNRLLSLALGAGLPDLASRTTVEPGRVWDYYLRADATWSDGTLVTSHDFLAAWDETRTGRDYHPLEHPLADALTDPRPWRILQTLEVEAYGPNRLRLRLRDDVPRDAPPLEEAALDAALRAWPLLPRVPWDPRGRRDPVARTPLTLGPYIVAHLGPGEAVLARREGLRGGPAAIRLRPAPPPERPRGRSEDFAWVASAPWGAPADGRPRLALDAGAADPETRNRLGRDLGRLEGHWREAAGWRLDRAPRPVPATAVAMGRVTLGCPSGALEGLARRVEGVLERAGVDVQPAFGRSRPPGPGREAIGVVVLYGAETPPEAVPLAPLAPEHVPGRRVPRLTPHGQVDWE